MISLYDYQTENALPPEMKTPERIALSYAFDRQKKKFLERLKRVYIWADIEQVDDDKLDFLAVECRVLFYNSSLAPDVKRNLIRNSIYWYMKLGTRQAMEEMIDTVFGNENTSVEEWFTYAGEPFHFRIAVGTEVTQTSIKEFLYYLNRIKNARSRFDYMVFQNGITLTIYTQSDYEVFYYTFCGEMECGTYPNTETGFQPAEVQITIETEGGTYGTDYPEAGTRPDISVGAGLAETQIDLQAASESNSFSYPANGDTEAGTLPDISVGAALAENQIDIQADSDAAPFDYTAAGDTESGTTPDISTGAAFGAVEVDLETESAGYTGVYEETGTAPDISVGAHFDEVQIDLEGSSDGQTVVYPSDSDTAAGSYPEPAVGYAGAESGVSVTPESEDFNLYYNTDADKESAEE